MKTLERGHGVSIAWIHERVTQGDYNVIHTRTDHETADIATKTFTDVRLWCRLRMLVNVYSPEQRKRGDYNPDNSYLPEKPRWTKGQSTNRGVKVERPPYKLPPGSFNT